MTRSIIAALATAVFATIAGCGGGSAPSPPVGPTGPEPLAPLGQADRLYYDNGAGITDSVRIVIRDPGTLRDVWSRATGHQTAPAPAPSVDFGEYMVVAVGAGRMTPQDRIRVDSVGVRDVVNAVGDDEEALLVVVRTIEGCRRFDLDAYPVEIVRVPRFEGSVRFLERREQDPNCRMAAAPSPETERAGRHPPAWRRAATVVPSS